MAGFVSSGPLSASAIFRRYVAGQGLSLIGTWVETVAQGLLVLQLTHSGFLLGLTTAARYCPILLLGPYAGLLVDRFKLAGQPRIATRQSVEKWQEASSGIFSFTARQKLKVFRACALDLDYPIRSCRARAIEDEGSPSQDRMSASSSWRLVGERSGGSGAYRARA
jgi:hypothetical protein